MAQMRMRRSAAQIEAALEQEMELDRKRRDQLRERAANRKRARKIRKVESKGKVRFGVLLVALTATVVVVVVIMFETLAWLMG
jgi:hypothetical protein